MGILFFFQNGANFVDDGLVFFWGRSFIGECGEEGFLTYSQPHLVDIGNELSPVSVLANKYASVIIGGKLEN